MHSGNRTVEDLRESMMETARTAHHGKHMGDPCATCMVCGSTGLAQRYSVRDTNQDVPGQWHILACRDCGTGVLCPFPDNVAISSFYRDVFYTNDGKRFRGWMEAMRGMFGRLRGIKLNRLKPQKGLLLDFGSGAGHFIAAQAKAGWHVHAVDPYSAASSYPDSCRLTEDGFELHYPDEYFDAITLWYVIEHMRNPSTAIGEFVRVLKPGGILILAQQDFASIQAQTFGTNWLYLDPPRHLWQFTAKSVAVLAGQHGLNVVYKSWRSIEMGPFSMLQSTLNMIVGNQNDLFRFLKNRNLPSATTDMGGKGSRFLPTVISLVLLPMLGPLILLAYFTLLLFHSGDVVTLYLRKS